MLKPTINLFAVPYEKIGFSDADALIDYLCDCFGFGSFEYSTVSIMGGESTQVFVFAMDAEEFETSEYNESRYELEAEKYLQRLAAELDDGC